MAWIFPSFTTGAPTNVSECTCPYVNVPMVGDEAAALASREVLAGLKAVGANIAKRADLPPVMFGAVGLSGIFNNHQAVFVGDGVQGVHIRGVPSHVHWKNAYRPLGYGRLHRGRVKGKAHGIDICQCQLATHGQRGAGCGDERIVGDDDLPTLPKTIEIERSCYGGGYRVGTMWHHQAVAGAAIVRERLAEPVAPACRKTL